MELLLIIILLPAAYVGLVRGTAWLLPATDTSRQLLRWGYWGSVAFVLLCWLAYTLGGWVFRFPAVLFAVFIGSGWLAGVRARREAASAGLRGWLAFHSAGCLPVALLLALGWLFGLQYEPIYRDDNVAVEATETMSWLSDNHYWKVTLHQNRNDLFEAEVGHLPQYVPNSPEYWRREWWADVERVAINAEDSTVTIDKCCGRMPVRVKYYP